MALYDEHDGLDGLLDWVRFDEVNPWKVYHAAFSRLPETPQLAVAPEGYDGRRHLTDALLSKEFQENVIRLFLQSFPERRRIIFVHIPKCAGTSLYLKLCRQFPALPISIEESNWTDRKAFFRQLRQVLTGYDEPNAIMVYGHAPLQRFINQGLLRPTDEIFTVVRDPASRVLSSVNYYLTRLTANPSFSDPDTREWAQILKLQPDTFDTSSGGIAALGLRILRDRNLVKDNLLCRYFGGDGDRGVQEPNVSAALNLIIRSDIEITDVSRYGPWLRERWGLEEGERVNESKSLLQMESLDAADMAYLQELVADDRRLYEQIIDRLERGDSLSLRGTALAK